MHGGTYAPLNGAAGVAGTTGGLGIAGGGVHDPFVDGHGMGVGEGAECGGHCTREAAAGCNRITCFVSAPLHLTGSIPVVFRPQSQYGLPSSHFRSLGVEAGMECGGSSEQRNASHPPNPTSICVLQSNHPPFPGGHPNQQQVPTSFHFTYCCPQPTSSTLPSLPPKTLKPPPHYVGVISTAPPPPPPFLPDDVSHMGMPATNPDVVAKPPTIPPSTSSLPRTLVCPASRTAGAPGLAVPPVQSLAPLPSSSFHNRRKEIAMTGPPSNGPPGVSTSLLISSGAPPPPRDPELRKNIEVLAQYVAKNGPEFEQRTKSDQSRNPKFRFLSGGTPGSVDEQAAEYYKWMKKMLEEHAVSCLVQPELSASPFLHQQGDYEQAPLPSSPSISNSDMDMEDDFAPPPPPEEHVVSENGDETQPSTIAAEHRSHSGSSSEAREPPPPPPSPSPLPAPLPPMYELSLGSPRKSPLVNLTPPQHCLMLVSGQPLSTEELDTTISPGHSQGGVDPPPSSHARVAAHFTPKSPSSAPSSPFECLPAPSSAGSLSSSSQAGTQLCRRGDELPAPSMERKAMGRDGDGSDHGGEEAGMGKAEIDDFARHQEQDWELPRTMEVRRTERVADELDDYGLKQADEPGDEGKAGKDVDGANVMEWQAESEKCRSRKVACQGVRHMMAGNEDCQEDVHQEGEKEGTKLDIPSERNRSPDEIRERRREGRRAGLHGPTYECVEVSRKSSPPAQTTTNSGERGGSMTVLVGQGGGSSRREDGTFSPVQMGLNGTVAVETGPGDEVAGRAKADETIVGGRAEGEWSGRAEPPEIVGNSGCHQSSAGVTRRCDAHASGSDEPSWGEKSRGRSLSRVAGRSSSRSDRSVNSSKSRSPCTAMRSRSPLSRSPLPRSRSPPQRRWRGRRSRSRSPRRWRRRSISRSRSPLRKRSHSRSPLPRRSRSRSPVGVRSRSRTPAGRRSRSRSPFRGGMRWGGGTPPHRVGGRWGEGGKGGRRGWGASKENVCYNFSRGRCVRGNSCRYLHVDACIGASDRRGAPERDGGYNSKSRGVDREWERVSRDVVDRGRRETSDVRREWNGDKVAGRDSFADDEWRDRRPTGAPREKWGDREESFEKNSERCGDRGDTRPQGGRSEDSARFGKGCGEPSATSPKEPLGDERARADKNEWQHGKAVNTRKEWVDEGVRTMESTEWDDRLATEGGPAVPGAWAEETFPYVKEKSDANECGWGNPPPPPPLAMETAVELGDDQLRHGHGEGTGGNKLGHEGLVTWGKSGTGDSENLLPSSAEGVELHGSIGIPISLGRSSSADLFAQMAISAVSETLPPGPLSSCAHMPHKSMASDVSVHCGDYNRQAPPQYGAPSASTSCLQRPSHGGTAPLPIVLIPPLAPLPLPLPLPPNQLPAQQHVPPLHQMQPLQPYHQVYQHQLLPPAVQQSPVTIRPQQVATSPVPPPPHVQMRVMHCMQGSPFSTMPPPPPLMHVPPPLPLGQTEGSTWGRLFLPLAPEQQQPPPPPPMYIAQKPVEELYDPLADGLDDGTSLRLPAEEALLKDVMPLSQDGLGSLPAKEWSPPTQLREGGLRPEAMIEVVANIDLRVPVEAVKEAASSPTANAVAVNVAEAVPGGDITVDTLRSDAISPLAVKQKESKGMLLLRNSVADVVKELLKPRWKEGHMSREAFKIIAKKAVDKVVGAVSPHAVPKNQRGVDAFLSGTRKDKIGKLVQGYVEKYVKA